MERSASRARRAFRLLLGATVVLAAAAGALAVAVQVVFLNDLPDLRSLEDYRPALSSQVVDRDGKPIGEFFEQRRRLIPLDTVPQHVIQAFLAAEDDTFYEHRGIDVTSVLRAAWANLRAGGETVQGASTITQQMVKQLLLSSERTYRRKVREMILAWRIEKHFSKDEILYLYLNEIYFGSGAYGIDEAARSYFGKAITEIDAGEAALLAGLPKAPTRFSPRRNPERAETRRCYVLDRMLDEGFIDATHHAQAIASPPRLRPETLPDDFAAAAYFTEEVRRRLVELLGNDVVLRGGLTVETTLDLELQRRAQRAVRDGLEALDQRHGYRGPLREVSPAGLGAELERLARENGLSAQSGVGALAGEGPWTGVVTALSKPEHASLAFAPGVQVTVALADVSWAHRPGAARGPVRSIEQVLAVGDVARFRRVEKPGEAARFALYQRPEAQGALLSFEVQSGEVLALVGGYDFAESEFDRATQALRQPGSAFKPIVYGAALQRGLTPASMLYDRPVVYEDPYTGAVWRPENYGRRFLGPLLMSEALARSVNNATIHLMNDIGVDNVVRYARRLGIEAPLEPTLSLALGSSAVSLLELTRAYAVFPAGGVRIEPIFIRRVQDRQGKLLLANVGLAERSATADAPRPGEAAGGFQEKPAPQAEPVIPAEEAYLMTDLLRGVVEHPEGTGRRARSLGRPVAGKTGTTNEQADAWFIGFSPDVVTGAWVGHDERRVLGHGETGGRAALPIWMDFMQAALADRAPDDFKVPDGIVFARIDARSGLLASAESAQVRFQPFVAGTAPTRSAETATNTSDRRNLGLDF